MKAKTTDLKGRKIVGVKLRPFSDGRGGKATSPLLVLDNGKTVWFTVDETEVGEYGVCICISERGEA